MTILCFVVSDAPVSHSHCCQLGDCAYSPTMGDLASGLLLQVWSTIGASAHAIMDDPGRLTESVYSVQAALCQYSVVQAVCTKPRSHLEFALYMVIVSQSHHHCMIFGFAWLRPCQKLNLVPRLGDDHAPCSACAHGCAHSWSACTFLCGVCYVCMHCACDICDSVDSPSEENQYHQEDFHYEG